MTFTEDASQAIRDSGGRMTAQRELLIGLLADTHEHLDAEGLYDLARTKDASISLATVYRTLNVLEEAGLLQQRYLSRDHERRYFEPVHHHSEHHFTCRKCRKVISFRSSLVQDLGRQLEDELGVRMLNICVCLDGLCPSCRAEAEAHEVTHEERA
jgi:Fur family ferric uptake transcriptional regulator